MRTDRHASEAAWLSVAAMKRRALLHVLLGPRQSVATAAIRRRTMNNLTMSGKRKQNTARHGADRRAVRYRRDAHARVAAGS
jgi:hypothetical protein